MSLPSHRRRVVITGLGVVSSNGVGRETFATAIRQGQSGILQIEGFDTKGIKSWAAAQVRGLDLTTVMEPVELRRVPRMVPLSLCAAREAVQQAGIREWIDAGGNPIERQRQIGVALGSGGGGLTYVEEQCRRLFTEGTVSLFSIIAGTHGNLSSELSIALGFRGPSHLLSTGCTSSTDALGYAAMLIRTGTVPMMLAGGADAPISHGILMGFEKMRVISTRRWDNPGQSSRPFSIDRDGFVLGEGAWMFVLEDADHADQRGATPLAEIAGYGSTCDAYHRVQIAPDVVEPVRAMELAMEDAGVAKDEVGYVNLHGTGTELNDRMETAAIRKCFGPRADAIPMSSTKSMIGHPQGAGGSAGIAAAVLGMRDSILHPTINLDNADPACDLDYIPNVARPGKTDVALCNCIAFGSKNSAMVIRRA